MVRVFIQSYFSQSSTGSLQHGALVLITYQSVLLHKSMATCPLTSSQRSLSGSWLRNRQALGMNRAELRSPDDLFELDLVCSSIIFSLSRNAAQAALNNLSFQLCETLFLATPVP